MPILDHHAGRELLWQVAGYARGQAGAPEGILVDSRGAMGLDQFLDLRMISDPGRCVGRAASSMSPARSRAETSASPASCGSSGSSLTISAMLVLPSKRRNVRSITACGTSPAMISQLPPKMTEAVYGYGNQSGPPNHWR